MAASIEAAVAAALKTLPDKPQPRAASSTKKRYSELMSAALAPALGAELRARGMETARPAGPGEVDAGSGAERRLSGGIGAKKVDVSWTTEESGLILGLSIKSINFRDGKTRNFQKNLINRRGDMLIEAVTLHRRFPYAVLGGLLFLDKDAENDGTEQRRSTFNNAFSRLRMFTGRKDPTGRDEQYERLYLVLVDANRFQPSTRCFPVDDPDREVSFDEVLNDLVDIVVDRNPDFYEPRPGGGLRRVGTRTKAKGKRIKRSKKDASEDADEVVEVGQPSDD